MSAPERVLELVDQFEKFKPTYMATSYKETEVRNHFIDPFFEALGWDVSNKAGRPPSTADVVLEYTLDSESGPTMPGYRFGIGGEVKFFVEAKKPSRNLVKDVDPAFQLRTWDCPRSVDSRLDHIQAA